MSSHTLSRTGTDSCLSVSRSRSRTGSRSLSRTGSRSLSRTGSRTDSRNHLQASTISITRNLTVTTFTYDTAHTGMRAYHITLPRTREWW